MRYLGFLFAMMSASVFATSPVETVPWNGHKGAVSFTFDDALESQIQNLAPMLDTMPDVKVTFFLAWMNSPEKTAVISGFADLAKKGHEIGNHTPDHLYLTNLTEDADFQKQIVDYADDLETLMNGEGANCKIVSFATPYCANSTTIQEYIGKRHFMNRDCGWTGRNNWNEEPKWLSMMAKTWTRSGNTVDEMVLALDTAALVGDFSTAQSWNIPQSEGAWLVMLNHGVVEDSDEYSINPEDMKTILNRARENQMWIAPFGTVGAYQRAHFVMDTASAIKAENGYSMEWELPHDHMPASIPLKVKLNSEWLAQSFDSSENIVIVQNENVIWADAENIYSIEFAAKALKIRQATAEEIEKHSATDRIQKRPAKNLRVKTNSSQYDANGRVLGKPTSVSVKF